MKNGGLGIVNETVLVNSSVELARKGSFITLFQNQKRLDSLTELASKTGWLGLASRAILAETFDEVGLYQRAEVLATREIGTQATSALGEEIKKPEPDRNIVRANAWLLLQCAISQFRRESGQTHGIDLLSQAIELFATNQGKNALRSQDIQSLFYFWRGRIRSSQYDFEKAEVDLQKALDVSDQFLEEELRSVEQMPAARRSQQIAAGNYVLASCLGFGLGHLRQLQGKLDDSLRFLRIAVPLSRGTVDFHRRGYVHLLMGIARRSLNDLDAADKHLEEATRLFGEPENENIPPHHVHLARVNHQLALSKLTRVPPGASGALSAEEKRYLRDAERLNWIAETESNHESCRGHRDPVLDYGIAVVHSLTKTALGDYLRADNHAEEAIRIIKDRSLPRWTHGSAWVAKGLALSERVQSRDQEREIRGAEIAFERAFSDETVFAADRAAAHLHLARLYARTGESYKASIHYDRACPLVEQSEYGSIKDLALRAREEVGNSLSFVCNFDVRSLLAEGAARGRAPWEYITNFITDELRKQLIRLKLDTLSDEDGVAKVASELGVSRATIYNWLGNAELKNHFTKRRLKREVPHMRE